VARTLLVSTAMLALLNAATALANFLLNLRIVNAISRLTLGVPELLAMGFAIWLIIYSLHRQLYSRLPEVAERRNFWELVGAYGKGAVARPPEDAR